MSFVMGVFGAELGAAGWPVPDLVAEPRRAKRRLREGRQALPEAAPKGDLDGPEVGAIIRTSPGSWTVGGVVVGVPFAAGGEQRLLGGCSAG